MAQNPNELFSELSDAETYAALCDFLYEVRGIPQYAYLSELCYLLDKESFMNLVYYYSGTQFVVPTTKEIAEAVQIMKLYNSYEIEKRPWKESVQAAGFDSSSGKRAKNWLNRLVETFKKYNIGNRRYR